MTMSNTIRLLAVGIFVLSKASTSGQDVFSEANALYKQGDYRAAARKYEEAVAANPQNGPAYFFLANSYDQQYRSLLRGNKDNDELLTKAVENYRKAVDLNRDRIRKLALEYLVAAFGPDKLNDPARAAPVAEEMIARDPRDTASY